MTTCARPFVFQKVSEFVYIFLFYVRWSGFGVFFFFSRGVSCLFTRIVRFVALLFSF